MSQTEHDAEVAEFIRTKGITRCPTVCLAPTQGIVATRDRLALRLRAEQHEALREEKLRSSKRWLSPSAALMPRGLQ